MDRNNRLIYILSIFFVIVCVPSQTFSPMYSLAKSDIHTAPYMTRDIYTDASQTKYISPTIGFDEPTYIPGDLTYIAHSSIRTIGKSKIRRLASDHLYALADAFESIHHVRLAIVSAHRTHQHQSHIYRACDDGFCAPAGHSEHQAGLAIDIFVTSTSEKFLAKKNFARYYARLLANAHRYGWHNSYRKGIDIDGYKQEPRHRRYLGIDLATLLYEQDMTFGERVTATQSANPAGDTPGQMDSNH